jgi:hypothetical protein
MFSLHRMNQKQNTLKYSDQLVKFLQRNIATIGANWLVTLRGSEGDKIYEC